MKALTLWIDNTLHPERYHGHGKAPPYFEGWYYKLVTADQSRRFAFIPGIFLSADAAQQHAFIQAFDGVTGEVNYHRFDAGDFWAARDRFAVQIGASAFGLDQISLAIPHPTRSVSGVVRFHNPVPYPVSAWSPGIMGPFGWLPFMECYHGLVSLDHGLEGALTIGDETIDFTGGRGYIEKDWGKSFPAGWVWMQTNHFEDVGACFSASIAVTPMLGGWFPGFIVAWWYGGRVRTWATYTGARVERLAVTEHEVYWALRDATTRLEITAERADASVLPGPNRVEMGKRVPETLKATIHLCVSTLSGSVIYEGTGRCAGLEVAGELERLLAAVNPKK